MVSLTLGRYRYRIGTDLAARGATVLKLVSFVFFGSFLFAVLDVGLPKLCWSFGLVVADQDALQVRHKLGCCRSTLGVNLKCTRKGTFKIVKKNTLKFQDDFVCLCEL